MEEEVMAIAQKYNKLAWRLIGTGALYFSAIAAYLIYKGFAFNETLIAIFILGVIGFVPLYYGIKHLLLPSILIVTDEKNIYLIFAKKQVIKIAMTDVKSIFPSTQSHPSYINGVEITTHDGQMYVRDRIKNRYATIQSLADKIYAVTGNRIDYYTLESLDGSGVDN